MKLLFQELTLLLLLQISPFTQVAHALVKVDAGVHEIPALLYRSGEKIYAIFNARSRSELKLLLKGPEVKKLKFKEASVLKIKISLKKNLSSSIGEATLLSFESISGSKVPPLVGDQLKPINPNP